MIFIPSSLGGGILDSIFLPRRQSLFYSWLYLWKGIFLWVQPISSPKKQTVRTELLESSVLENDARGGWARKCRARLQINPPWFLGHRPEPHFDFFFITVSHNRITQPYRNSQRDPIEILNGAQQKFLPLALKFGAKKTNPRPLKFQICATNFYGFPTKNFSHSL